MKTRQDAHIWLLENKTIITVSSRLEPQQIDKIYKVYNLITGENKRHSGCSKCLFNTLKRLRAELDKIKDKKLVVIYRTPFKQLTLKPQKEIAYQFLVKDDDELNEKLEMMKKIEKSIN